MSSVYKYGSHHHARRLLHLTVILGISLIIIAGIVAAFLFTNHHKNVNLQSVAQSVPQPSNGASTQQIKEPYFTFQLPSDWRKVSSVANPTEHSITWQTTAKGVDSRILTVYIDTIPSNYPVNRELPVTVNGNRLQYGDLSDNCATFTPGGSLDTRIAVTLQPKQAVWESIDFICNLQNVVDDQVGTGSTDGINRFTITGPQSGTHSYFFLYIDRNITPDYNILLNAIQSFRAL